MLPLTCGMMSLFCSKVPLKTALVCHVYHGHKLGCKPLCLSLLFCNNPISKSVTILLCLHPGKPYTQTDTTTIIQTHKQSSYNLLLQLSHTFFQPCMQTHTCVHAHAYLDLLPSLHVYTSSFALIHPTSLPTSKCMKECKQIQCNKIHNKTLFTQNTSIKANENVQFVKKKGT